MKCPHCGINFHDNWEDESFFRGRELLHTPTNNSGSIVFWTYRSADCPGCHDITVCVGTSSEPKRVNEWRQVYPIGANRGPTPAEVPGNIAADYIEACNVLPISPKASAALSRRCLQSILHVAGYRDRDLAREIDQLLGEPDPKKALPSRLRETVDAIRNFGNFSAHPIDDKTTLQIIDVEPHEAEWCLELIEELFEHFYVGPAVAAAKKAALNAKLAVGGKPPAK
jgi:hypothetical protein